MKVLIVDDLPGNRKLLRVTLEAEGFTTVEASDGLDALAVLRAQQADQDPPVDAIISDILMPGMDGFRLCQAVRSSEEFGYLPIVIYTVTYTSPSDEKLALQAGADRYIRKPCSTTTLVNALLEVTAIGHTRAAPPSCPAADLELAREYSRALVTKLEERNSELETLLAISEDVNSTLDVRALLIIIADRLERIVPYTGLAVYRVVEDGESLSVAYYEPDEEERAESAWPLLPIDDVPELREVIRTGKPVLIPDISGDSPVAHTWRSSSPLLHRLIGDGARCWLGVPLKIKDRVIGVLRLSHDEPARFGEHDAELALAFARHAAMAMENARLYEQAKELAAMEERQRLARDLHDLVSQTLFSASLTADVLPKLYARDPDHGQQLLAELRRMNRGALAELRALLIELRPQALLEADLGTLLTQLAEAAAGRSNTCISVVNESVCPVPGEVQVALYRITQEALHNVAKHAKAREALVCLRCVPGPGGSACRVELSIADDGIGFDLERVPANQFGLSIMGERAVSIGAALEIATARGHGTTVSVIWPAG